MQEYCREFVFQAGRGCHHDGGRSEPEEVKVNLRPF